MPPRYLTNSHPEAPRTLPMSYQSGWSACREIRGAHIILPRGVKLVAPPKGCYDDTPSPLPLPTALSFYHTGSRTDSATLQPFLQLIDGDPIPRTLLMQPLSPGLVSWSHVWEKRGDRGIRGEREERWGQDRCVFVCRAEREASRVFHNPVCVCALLCM